MACILLLSYLFDLMTILIINFKNNKKAPLTMNAIKLFFLTGLFVSTFSLQASEPPIQLTMSVKKEVTTLDAQGNQTVKYLPPTQVTPGDTVLYTTEYHNQSTKTLHGVMITNPIPKHLIYLNQHSGQNKAQISYSINHGKHFLPADQLVVKKENGKEQLAKPSDYTHIRWTIPSVTAGQKGQVSFRAKLQ